MDLQDKLTFRNYKGEEKILTRQEFRNAARGQPDIDHRPKEALQDLNYKQEATPPDLLFKLTKINNKEI